MLKKKAFRKGVLRPVLRVLTRPFEPAATYNTAKQPFSIR